MNAQEIAKASGKSVTTIYNYAKKLGRLPTVEEAKKGFPMGRPPKYKPTDESYI